MTQLQFLGELINDAVYRYDLAAWTDEGK